MIAGEGETRAAVVAAVAVAEDGVDEVEVVETGQRETDSVAAVDSIPSMATGWAGSLEVAAAAAGDLTVAVVAAVGPADYYFVPSDEVID